LTNPAHAVLGLGVIPAFSSCGGSGCKEYQTGSYAIRGQYHQPLSVDDAFYNSGEGSALWYDEGCFFGLIRGTTSLGERVGRFDISGAHKTLPIPCRVRVTNLENEKSLKMRLIDRGLFIAGRIIDVTLRAAAKPGFQGKGPTRARGEVLSVGGGSMRGRLRDESGAGGFGKLKKTPLVIRGGRTHSAPACSAPS